MRMRIIFALPTLSSNGEDQMKSFQVIGAVQLFVVWFMGLG